MDGERRLRKLVLRASIGSASEERGVRAGRRNSAYQSGTDTGGISSVWQKFSKSSGTLSNAECP